MAQTVTFDMYVRTNNAWQQYERFIEQEQEDALNTARKLDQEPAIEGVRIIRVTAFGGDRAPLETLEWISPHLRKNAAPAKRGSGRKAETAETAEAPSPEDGPAGQRAASGSPAKVTPRGRRNRKAPVPLILKTIMIVLVTGTLAAVLYAPARGLLGGLLAAGLSTPPVYLEIGAFSLCALFFVLLAATGFYFFVTQKDIEMAFHGKPAERPATRRPTGQPGASPAPLAQQTGDTPAETTAVHEHAPAGDAEDTPDLDSADAASLAAAYSAQRNGTEDPPPAEGPSKPAMATGLDQDYRLSMLRFLEGSLTELADILKTLDQYSLFGINLYLGGAGDQFGAVNGLNGIQRFILIRETISALGTQPDMVDVFCEKFADYDQDPKYRFMTEAGRAILLKYLAGDDTCFRPLPELIRRWRKSGSAVAQAQGIIVIMFTDLVGSTQMTHDHGDMGAQAVVRAHNAIVRNALAQFHGEEVKHTGDGIMASFANGPNAVRAAISIQREIAAHNGANPQLPVRVRIGLNAGDAVREEDDFFGQTVQLAARICDKADADEIYITPFVQALCRDHAFVLSEAGPFELKGIDEPVLAHSVGWQQPESAAAEAPDEAADEPADEAAESTPVAPVP